MKHFTPADGPAPSAGPVGASAPQPGSPAASAPQPGPAAAPAGDGAPAPRDDGATAPRDAVTAAEAKALARHCMGYREADDARAWRQLLPTLGLYLATFAALLWGVAAGIWAALALAPAAGLLLVRLFTIQHDCGHNSFFASRAANTWVGRVLSVLTLTPYDAWRREHARHHSSAGDLDHRGIGDVGTLTVREYEALGWRQRLGYRIYRHPLILHVLGPPLYFVLFERSPFGHALPARELWRSIMALNLALAALYGGLMLVFGVWPTLIAVTSVALVASWVGAWLFFIQHQFEHTHWEDGEAWDLHVAALNGSSYYVLPPLLNWLTGNIGLHHIHHLNSRVPSYRLQECMAGDARLASISRLSLGESLRCIGLSLWDEDERRLIRFSDAPASASA